MEAIEKAKILIEALPYIQNFHGKTFVIKYGGNAMLNQELKESFAKDLVLLKLVGINPVIVHGGGPQIDDLLKKLGKETNFVQGLRVTDSETMDVVEMVLGGKINKDIVGLINRNNGKAVGLSGKDGQLIRATKAPITDGIDLGMVGSIVKVNPEIILTLEKNGFIPVISPVGEGDDGKTYNINADEAAGEIAASLKAEKLIILTDVEGILDKNNSLISTLKVDEVNILIEQGIIQKGMIPKVKACLMALTLNGKVKKAHIIDGRIKHVLLLEIFTKEGIGTQIVPP